MAVREDLVASAAKFLQDPSVASSPVENRISFLQAKNMTPEEVSAALARAGQDPGTPITPYSTPAQPGTPHPARSQQFYGQFPPYAWQPPPPEPPRRDWRDWFIMATVVGGVSYGLFSLTKRYVYPLVAPPTPERLEQDKKSIDEQFDKAFALVDQLAKDTEALKAAEAERTERLDGALSDLESVINELKTANKRRDQEIQRHRDDVQGLRDQFPKALESHKDMTDNRLKEVNAELKSLKALISQRMNSGTAAQTSGSGSTSSNHLRPSSGNATPVPTSSSPAPSMAATVTPAPENDENNSNGATTDASKSRDYNGYVASLSRNSPAPGAAGPKASIPAWQMSMQSKGASPAASAAESSSGAAQESSSSS